jgi:hypothetical protein
VDQDSLPLHIIGKESPATEVTLARLMMEQPVLWQLYGSWLALLQPATFEEVEAMARSAGKKVEINWQPLLDDIAGDTSGELLNRILKAMIKNLGKDRFLERVREISEKTKPSKIK